MNSEVTAPISAVFVGGSGRSGTTFVYRMLAASSGLRSLGDIESKLFSGPDSLIDLHAALVDNYDLGRASRTLVRVQAMLERNLSAGDLGDGAADVVGRFAWSLMEGGIAQPLTQHEWVRAVQRLMHLAFDLDDKTQPDRIIEKTPHHINQARHLDTIFERPLYVDVIRDPRAVVHSLRRMNWAPDDLEGCVEWLRAYLKARKAQQIAASADLRQRTLAVRLEDIVTDASRESSRIADFLSLSDIDFTGAVQSGPALAWQSDMSESDQAFVLARLAEHAAEWGYGLTQ